MSVSLFFGVRYSFIGRDDMTEANKLIGKASEAADYVKEKFDKDIELEIIVLGEE